MITLNYYIYILFLVEQSHHNDTIGNMLITFPSLHAHITGSTCGLQMLGVTHPDWSTTFIIVLRKKSCLQSNSNDNNIQGIWISVSLSLKCNPHTFIALQQCSVYQYPDPMWCDWGIAVLWAWQFHTVCRSTLCWIYVTYYCLCGDQQLC